jgi:hypothetical protein
MRNETWAWALMAAIVMAVAPAYVGCASGGGSDLVDAGDAGEGPLDAEIDAAECGQDEDCDDGSECNVGSCIAGTCFYRGQHDLCGEAVGCIVPRCQAGSCTEGPEDGECDDGNECTVNTCDAEGSCGVVDAADGLPCLFGMGTCDAGSCELTSSEKSVFRVNTLTLEDPNVHARVLNSCINATGIANGELASAIEELDLNFVFTFDPSADPSGQATPLELWLAECESPTECTVLDEGEPGEGEPGEDEPSEDEPEELAPIVTTARIRSAGVCFAPREGTVHFGDPNTVTAPCWSTEEFSIEFDLGGIIVPLEGVQAGGRMDGADAIVDGLMAGFLTQEAAEQIELPEEFAQVLGGGTVMLSEVLPPLSCSDVEARSTHNGEIGWWFYLNFTAERVTEHSGF